MRYLSTSLSKYSREPLFWLGLFVKLFLITFAVPAIQARWFIPFMAGSLDTFSLDPWGTYLGKGGDIMAFPYGIVMYLIYLPFIAIGVVLSNFSGESQNIFRALGFANLLLDFSLLVLLQHLFNRTPKSLLLWYWLSPIVLYICYWHGQLDLVPVLLFIASLLALKNRQPILSGALLGLGVSAKLSVLFALPFTAVYLWRSRAVRKFFWPFMLACLGTCSIFTGFFLFLDGFRKIVFGSPEIAKVYQVALSLGDGNKVYFLPVVYCALLYTAWRIQRLNFTLFFSLSGVAFFCVLLLTPASSGWFLWIVPFLVASQLFEDKASAPLGLLFSLTYVVLNLLFTEGASVPLFNLLSDSPLLTGQTHFQSLLLTFLWILGTLVAARMVVHGVRRSDFFRLSRRPLTIGIAGDSGSGKDTLAAGIAVLFGEERVTSISGDDYHKWDRAAPMWKTLTHLDVRANDLPSFTRDVISLLDGKKVRGREYDHESGRFRRASPKERRDVLLVSGLHALAIEQVRNKLDISIYLDMEESLRRALKVKRDHDERGKLKSDVLASIDSRSADGDRFIRPQSKSADLIFSLRPVENKNAEQCIARNSFCLDITIKNSLSAENVVSILVGLCGMYVDYLVLEDNQSVQLSVEGDIDAEDIALAAQSVTRELGELLSFEPVWERGMLGIMQLVSLFQIRDTLRGRLAYGT